MKILYVLLICGLQVGAKPSPPKLPAEAFEIKFVPRAVVTERKYLRYDATLPGYQIESAIDAIKIRPKHPSKSPAQFVLRLHTGGLEYFALQSADITIESSGNTQVEETVALASKGNKTQLMPRGTYFQVKEEKGIFQIAFTPRALALLKRECTFKWINYYRC